MATFNPNVPANSTSERTQFTHTFQSGVGTLAATAGRPTSGQLWPRGNR